MGNRIVGGARTAVMGLVVGAATLGTALPAGAAKPTRPPSDTTPPTINVQSPVPGATVSSTLSVAGTASDNVGVTSVRIAVDGGPPTTAAGTTSWSWAWDTAAVANGSHTITASALDAAGRTSSSSRTVTVANVATDTASPSVAFASPAAGSSVSGTAVVSGTASDNTTVSQVEVAVDGGPWALAAGTSSWSWSWDTTSVANGTHTLASRARDGAGNTSTTSRSVTVGNAAAETTAPTVAFTGPASGSTISGTVAVTGTAGDNAGLASVEVAVDGGAYATVSGTTTWSWSWATASLANGSHSLTARATDTSGNSATATRSVIVSNGSGAPATQGSWVSPEGVKINVTSAGPWTISQVYGILKANARDLDKVGPRLTINVQDQYSTICSTSASTSGGVYSSFSATINLKGVSSSFATSPDRGLAHEYGHAWTMYHHYLTQQGDWSPYLDSRWTVADGSVVLADDSRLGSSYGWTRDELIADDYRLLFGSPAAISQAPSHMNTAIVDPRSQPGLRDWFLQQWAA